MKITLEFESMEEFENYQGYRRKDVSTGPATPELNIQVEEKQPFDRDAIKQRLTDLGVNFNDKARTDTLAAQLEAFEADNPEIDEVEEVVTVDEPTPDTAEVVASDDYTAQDVREFLQQVTEKDGMAVAKEILTKYEAKNISTLDPSNYAGVIEGCKEVL